jgi:hypothetical protein
MADIVAPVVTAGVAALSALAYVAYKHPEGYRRNFLPLLRFPAWGGLLGWICFTLGVHTGTDLVRDNLPAEISALLTWPRLLMLMLPYAAGLVAFGAFIELLGNLKSILGLDLNGK